ncbi:uncharacterized protein LOC141656983 [Silene latifolia]|uniref:uncharacterized protein LOC141656983 n=1 Tax=Silene latifolia TaxID=37657 RepID=UPI003D785EC4
MDSPQSVVSPFKNLSVSGAEPEKQRSDVFGRGSDQISNRTDKPGTNGHKPEDFIGVLEVYVHHARDIQNICIYHKQDVYAKLCLTSDPDNTVSTHTVNGGGKNPVFNDKVRINVRTIETSVKCEIWMLSRVKNYLEDQLLGFALVPLSEILLKNGKVEREFSLSSTDLFHSPAGFVQLSLAYSGSVPEVMTIPKLPSCSDNIVEASDFDQIEFPDPKMLTENEMMVSEYVGMECDRDSQTTENLVSSEKESHELGVRVVESFSANSEESNPLSHVESPPRSESSYGSQSVSLPASSQTSETQVTSKSEVKDSVEGEGESSNGHAPSKETLVKPLLTVNIEPEATMVQQDIVDMYMKSMQQFTESLAKMKLPMDLTPESSKSENSSSDQTTETPKSTGSRVFYGSRAFF